MRRLALKRYLTCCRQRHALAFFQWRSRREIFSKDGLVRAVFATRLEQLRLRNEFKERLLAGKINKESQKAILARASNPTSGLEVKK